jgi:hypothetical protein
MNVIEAMKLVCENNELEARCDEYRKYLDGDQLRHARVNSDGVFVSDCAGFDWTDVDWTIHYRATGALYVPPETAPSFVKTMVRLPCRNNTFMLVDPAEVADINNRYLDTECLVSIKNHSEEDSRLVLLPPLEAADRLGIKVADAIEGGSK